MDLKLGTSIPKVLTAAGENSNVYKGKWRWPAVCPSQEMAMVKRDNVELDAREKATRVSAHTAFLTPWRPLLLGRPCGT